jgi:hypothetical protein
MAEQGVCRSEFLISGLFLKGLIAIGRILAAKLLTGGQQLGRSDRVNSSTRSS